MAVSYSWKITQMTKKTVADTENVVLHIRWELKGTDSTTGTVGAFSGATPLDFDPSNVDEFTAYGDLTEEIVVSWLENIVTGSYWEHVSERIAEQIAKVDDPEEEVSEFALPWSTGSVEDTPSVDTESTGSGE